MNKKLLIVGVILILLFPLTLVMGWFYGKSLTKIYSSYTTVLFDNNKEPVDGNSYYSNPIFLQTQFEIIKSKTIILPVIQKLGLDEKIRQRSKKSLTEPEIYRIFIQRYLRVGNYRQTTLIEIEVQSPDPDEAALIANTVAEQYVLYRTSKMQESADSQPDCAPAVIVNQAEPNPYPVKPKFALIMIVSGIVGLVPLSAGGILLIVAAVWCKK